MRSFNTLHEAAKNRVHIRCGSPDCDGALCCSGHGADAGDLPRFGNARVEGERERVRLTNATMFALLEYIWA